MLDSGTVPPIRNCVDIIKAFTLWVKHSAKREGLFKKIIEKRSQIGTKQQSLLNVCVTRWVENIDGWERFSQYHPFLIEICEVIIYGNSEFESYNDGWNAEDKKNSLAHLKALESFEFAYSLVTIFRSLLYVKSAVISLQGPSNDLISGISKVKECCKDLQERENIEQYTLRIFQHSSRLANKSQISISMPRITQRQQHRFNPRSSSVEEYFKQTIAIPFLDYLTSIATRFDKHTTQVAALQSLLPAYLETTSSLDDIRPTIAFYSEDLPMLRLLMKSFIVGNQNGCISLKMIALNP